MRPRQEVQPATNAREALQQAVVYMQRHPASHLDLALVKAVGLPADGKAWTAEKQQVYCSALDILRLYLPTWSITGYSQSVGNEERLEMLRRAAK